MTLLQSIVYNLSLESFLLQEMCGPHTQFTITPLNEVLLPLGPRPADYGNDTRLIISATRNGVPTPIVLRDSQRLQSDFDLDTSIRVTAQHLWGKMPISLTSDEVKRDLGLILSGCLIRLANLAGNQAGDPAGLTLDVAERQAFAVISVGFYDPLDIWFTIMDNAEGSAWGVSVLAIRPRPKH